MDYIIKESLNLQQLESLKDILCREGNFFLFDKLNDWLDNNIYKWDWLCPQINYNLDDIFITCELVEINKDIINNKELESIYNLNDLRNCKPSKEIIKNYIKEISRKMKKSYKGGVIQHSYLMDLYNFVELLGIKHIKEETKELKTTYKDIETYLIIDYNIKFQSINTYKKDDIFKNNRYVKLI